MKTKVNQSFCKYYFVLHLYYGFIILHAMLVLLLKFFLRFLQTGNFFCIFKKVFDIVAILFFLLLLFCLQKHVVKVGKMFASDPYWGFLFYAVLFISFIYFSFVVSLGCMTVIPPVAKITKRGILKLRHLVREQRSH